MFFKAGTKFMTQVVDLLKTEVSTEPQKYLDLPSSCADNLPPQVAAILHMARTMAKLPSLEQASAPLKQGGFHDRLVILNQLDGLDLSLADKLVPNVREVVTKLVEQTVLTVKEYNEQAMIDLAKANAYLEHYKDVHSAATDWNLDLVRPLFVKPAESDSSKDQTEVDVLDMIALLNTVAADKLCVDRCIPVFGCKGICKHEGFDEAKLAFIKYKKEFQNNLKDDRHILETCFSTALGDPNFQ